MTQSLNSKNFFYCVLKSKNLLMRLFVHMNAIIVLLQFSYWQNHVFFINTENKVFIADSW